MLDERLALRRSDLEEGEYTVLIRRLSVAATQPLLFGQIFAKL